MRPRGGGIQTFSLTPGNGDHDPGGNEDDKRLFAASIFGVTPLLGRRYVQTDQYNTSTSKSDSRVGSLTALGSVPSLQSQMRRPGQS